MFRPTVERPGLNHEHVTVRYATVADESALARLAALDSARPPRGPALIADPFEPTAELVALLQLRAEQLDAGERRPRRALVQRLRGFLRAPAW